MIGEGAVCAPPEDGCAIAPELSGEGNDRAQQRNVKTHAKMRLPLLSSNYFHYLCTHKSTFESLGFSSETSIIHRKISLHI